MERFIEVGILRLRFRMFLGNLIEASRYPLLGYLFRVRDAFVEAPDDIALQVVERHGTIEAFVWDRVAFLAGDDLASGDHHLYRGVLDPEGDGNDILSVYDYCVDQLERIGNITHDQGDYMKGHIRGTIMISG